MSKKLLLGIVAVVVLIILAALLGKYIGYDIGYERAVRSALPTEVPPKVWEREFNINEVKVGDKVAGMTVASAKPFNDSFSGLSEDNASISFSGEVTLKGNYFHNDLGENTCFQDLNESSQNSLPKVRGDERGIWFCFENETFAETSFGSTGKRGEADIVIDNYTINFYPSEVWNTATLVKVLSKD